jgi:hypothetical protein
MVPGSQLASAVDHEEVGSGSVADIVAQTTHHSRHPDELSCQADHFLHFTEHMAALHDGNAMLVIVERVSSLIVLVLQLLQECR